MRRRLVCLALAASFAGTARADIAVLTSGLTFKVASYRVEDGTVFLALKDGGEVGLPATSLRGVVPDEVIDEVVSANANASSGDLRQLAMVAAKRHGLDPDLVMAVVSGPVSLGAVGMRPRIATGR